MGELPSISHPASINALRSRMAPSTACFPISGAVKAVKVLKHSETVGIGSVAVEKIPAAIVKSNKADVAAVTGASVTSKAIEQAVEVALAKATGKSLKAKFKPGTYKSQAYGNNGYLNVEVTVTKDKIKSIKVPANQETPFMGVCRFLCLARVYG